jgi:acetate kinase
MKILVINSGSSSIKFQLIEIESRTSLGKGMVDRIGLQDGLFRFAPSGRDAVERTADVADHRAGIRAVLEALTDLCIIRDPVEIDAVGHRMVLAGPTIAGPVVFDEALVRLVERYTRLAPLHNPPTLAGYRAAAEALPGVPHVGVFDTAFYAPLPARSFVYPIPYEYYERHGIRRFGFHGMSHQYVTQRAAEFLARDPCDFRCVTCHLGNGASVAGVKDGRPVYTSLGFGTMAGLMMGTRAGDVDPDVVLYLLDTLKMSTAEVRTLLYRNSGLKGISGISNDLRDIERAADTGNARAVLALEMFAGSAARHAAAAAVGLEGRLDALVFTAGIGENSPRMRAMIGSRLGLLGVAVDREANDVRGVEAVVSPPDARVPALVIPTNEELMIALETRDAVARVAVTRGASPGRGQSGSAPTAS